MVATRQLGQFAHWGRTVGDVGCLSPTHDWRRVVALGAGGHGRFGDIHEWPRLFWESVRYLVLTNLAEEEAVNPEAVKRTLRWGIRQRP